MAEDAGAQRLKQLQEAAHDATTTVLIRDLECEMPTDAIGTIMKNAKTFMYDDFKSSLATPKQTLYEHLTNAKLPRLAAKCLRGEYD